MHLMPVTICEFRGNWSRKRRGLPKGVNAFLPVTSRFILYINKIQRDATVCKCLFTAKLLYMFRVSIAPIIGSTKNCKCSFWYRS